MKVYYYNPYLEKNGTKTSIPFYQLLDHIYPMEPEQKHKELKIGEYSLLKMRDPRNNFTDINDRSVCLADYRDRKPKIGERRSDRFEDIDDDVIESTNFFFQNSSNLLMMEYNHYGAKANHFEKYLSSFLPSDEETTWSVVLEEISAPIGLRDVLDSGKIHALEIKLDLSTSQQRLFIDETEQRSVILNAIEGIANGQEEIGGNVATISFGNGRKRDNRLKTGDVKAIIRVLDLESDNYINIRVDYFSNALGRRNEIDLKNAHILKDEIDTDGDAWETIADSLERHFYENGRNGQEGYTRFISELVTEESPF